MVLVQCGSRTPIRFGPWTAPNHLVLGPLEFEIPFSKKYFSFEEGKKVGTQVSAHEVIECSALENINIQDVFTRAARIALTEKKAKSKGCCTIS